MMTKEGGTDYDEQGPSLGKEDWKCHLPRQDVRQAISLTAFAFIFNGERDMGSSNLNLVHLSGLCKSKEGAPADTSARASHTYRNKLYL